MKRRFDVRHLPLLGLLAALLLTLAVPARPAAAQTRNAYSNNYRTTLAYMNLGATTAQVTFTFNPASGNALTRTKTLAPNAATFLTMVGATNTTLGFSAGTTANNRRGNVVVSSTQRIIAVVVQTDRGSPIRTRNRLLSTGFTSDSVDTAVYIPTYVKNASKMSSRLAIQNAAGSTVSYVARFFGSDATPVLTSTGTIAANKAAYLDALSVSGLPNGFTGSAIVTATGGIVASVIEAQSVTQPPSNQPANAQLGIPAAATAQLINLPSALCSVGGRSTTLAVQNAGATTTNVTPVLIGSSGSITGTAVSVEPGVKAVVRVCDVLSQGTSGVQTSFDGAMQLSSDTENIAVIAKEDGRGHSSAFEGQPTTAAGDTLVAPYVRNAQTTRYNNAASGRLRSSIIIQNVGSSELAAGDVLVNYYDSRGRLIGTHTINSAVPVGGSVTSNPGQMTLESSITAALNSTNEATLRNNFGYVFVARLTGAQNRMLGTGEGGGAVITCAADVVECALLATVRVTGNNTATNGSTTNNHAEMYNAVPTN